MSHDCVYVEEGHTCGEPAAYAVIGHTYYPAHCEAMRATLAPLSNRQGVHTIHEFCETHAEAVATKRNTAWQEAVTRRQSLRERLTRLRKTATLEA